MGVKSTRRTHFRPPKWDSANIFFKSPGGLFADEAVSTAEACRAAIACRGSAGVAVGDQAHLPKQLRRCKQLMVSLGRVADYDFLKWSWWQQPPKRCSPARHGGPRAASACPQHRYIPYLTIYGIEPRVRWGRRDLRGLA